MAASVGGLGERVRHATRDPSSRKTPTNSLTPTLSRPAGRHPRAGPAGGPQLPDNLYLADRRMIAAATRAPSRAELTMPPE